MKKNYIIFSSLIACILLYAIEQLLMTNYMIKTAVKILLFTIVPWFYIKFLNKSKSKEYSSYNKSDRHQLKYGLIFGISSFFIILLAYYLLGKYINIEDIVGELQSKSKITPDNFGLVGLYIILGNSFLEEFFFRGFIFLKLYEMGSSKEAYIYSSVLFGLYHIAIFKTWFNVWLIALALIGLVSIGFIFNWLDTKSGNFINSWIVHILADCAIILIGLKLFMII